MVQEPVQSEDFDPYYKWLGIPPEEQPPHHYRLLAIPPFTTDPEVIENAADQRMAHLRAAQIGKRAALSQDLLNHVAQAKACLLDDARRAEYDEWLVAAQAASTPEPPPHVQTSASPDRPPIPVTSTRRGSRKAVHVPIQLIGAVLGGPIGIAMGYLVICWIHPRNDVLGVFTKAPERNIKGANSSVTTASPDLSRRDVDVASPNTTPPQEVQPAPTANALAIPPQAVVAEPKPISGDSTARLLASIPTSPGIIRNDTGELVELECAQTTLVAWQLETIASIPTIRLLRLPYTNLDDTGLEKLRPMPSLTILGIWHTKVTNDGLRHVGEMTSLQWFSVEGVEAISDEGVAHLSSLQELSHLGLGWTRVTDDGMPHLTRLGSLQSLRLDQTGLTDRGLETLASIKTLRQLSIGGTAVTDAGIAKLKVVLPDCEVVR